MPHDTITIHVLHVGNEYVVWVRGSDGYLDLSDMEKVEFAFTLTVRDGGPSLITAPGSGFETLVAAVKMEAARRRITIVNLPQALPV